MKALKKIIMMILTVIACLSIILMCAERPDGSICLTWSLGWMAALVVSTKLLDRMGVFNKSNL